MVGKSSSPFLWLFVGIVVLVLLAGCIIPQQQGAQPDRQSTMPPKTVEISPLITLYTPTPEPTDPVHALPLTRTLWTLESYLGDNRTMVPVTITVTEHFNATTGSISGNSGCNDYGYSYNLSGQNGISTKPVFSTLVFCFGPRGTTEYFYRYLLHNASSYETTPDGLLNIRDASGTVILVYSGQETPFEEPAVHGTPPCSPIFPVYHAPFNQTKFDYDLEKEIFSLINTERSSRGIPLLIWDDRLALIARDHSEDMALNRYFGYTNSRGKDPTVRAIRYGYPVAKKVVGVWQPGSIGENLAQMSTGEIRLSCPSEDMVVPDSVSGIAGSIMEYWMNHGACQQDENQKNILNPDFSNTGVGVAFDGKYYMVTQDFW